MSIKLPMYLTPVQQLALPTIKWLINHDKTCIGTGRTTLVAYAIIETALDNPKQQIEIWDHSGSYDSKKHTLNRILQLWEYLKINELGYELEVNKTNMTIKARSLHRDKAEEVQSQM